LALLALGAERFDNDPHRAPRVAIDALREGRCTLAVAGDDVRDPRIQLEDLSFNWRAAVAAPTHPLGARSGGEGAPTAADLADHAQIVAEDPSALTEGRDFGVLSPRTWRVSDNATKHALILAGVGWGTLPLWMVERDLAEGRLRRIATAEFGPEGETLVRLYLAHRTDVPLGPAGRLLRSLLLESVERVGIRRP
jgi:DNA-binding transcriptional LysR family regulator